MKRCDLHIHTVQSISDWEFTFDKDILVDYVSKTGLDVIAITNHNQFDYAQFLEIKECLPNITVLPGIEVDLEKGHILVISNGDDGSLYDFNAKCVEVKKRIQTPNDYITIETFNRIFTDLGNYLLIPHYDKAPQLPKEVIAALGGNIVAGEVSSVKKFIYMKKEAAETLSPVLFSDFRIRKGVSPDDYPVNHTYLDVNDVNVSALKLCLMDKGKVWLTAEKGVK